MAKKENIKLELPVNSICIIDGSALAYRAFYGLPVLKTLSGVETQAVLGFYKSLLKVFQSINNSQLSIVITWDSFSKERSETYKEYKANRQQMPSSLSLQLNLIKKIAENAGISQLEIQGAEADDIIFSIVQANRENFSLIVTPDKDLLQLVLDNRAAVFDPTVEVFYNQAAVENKFGFGAEKIRLYHALLGDASDNIPGVSGIGKKTAAELVLLADKPEELFKKLDTLAPRTSKLLQAGHKDLLLSYDLFGLKTFKVPPASEFEVFKIEKFENSRALLQELELKSLLAVLPKSDNNSTMDEKKPNFDYNWLTFTEIETIDQISKLELGSIVAVDTETEGLEWTKNNIISIAFAQSDNSGWFVNLTDKSNSFINALSEKLFQVQGRTFIFHNAKFDLHFLAKSGLCEPSKLKIYDTLLAWRIVRQTWQKCGLKELSKEILDIDLPSFTDLEKFKKSNDFKDQIFKKYAVADAIVCWQLFEKINQVISDEQKKLLEGVELPLLPVLWSMEKDGILVNTAKVDLIESQVQKELSTLDQKLRAALQHLDYQNFAEINFLSPKQVQELIFGFLDLGKFLKVKSSSTDKDVLSELASINPIPGMIVKFRNLAKVKGTYLEPVANLIACDGAIHTTFNQVRVATGRLSSENPNMQNLPTQDSPEGHLNIRSMFVSRPGRSFISADYEQIELRMLAHLCSDEELISAFLSNKDIHKITACSIFGRNSEDLTNAERQVGKRVNFGVIYGLSAFGLSQQLSCSRSDADAYIKKFFEQYSGVKKWMEKTLSLAKAQGFVKTILGRTRHIENINDRNAIVAKAAERVAINTPVQGSAADLIKLAMISVSEAIDTQYGNRAKLLLQIHDELIVEAEDEILDQVCQTIENCMENAIKLSVPLKVGIQTGKDLGF